MRGWGAGPWRWTRVPRKVRKSGVFKIYFLKIPKITYTGGYKKRAPLIRNTWGK